MANEYERRFLLRELPRSLDWIYVKVIRQVYWELGNGWVLRLRRQGEDESPDDVWAVKGPRRGSSRPEFEWPFLKPGEDPDDESLHVVASLYRAGASRQVVKTRRGAAVEGDLWDFDEFHFANEGLLIAEVEMEDQDALNRLARPEWTLREVTLEAKYQNENLAARPFQTW